MFWSSGSFWGVRGPGRKPDLISPQMSPQSIFPPRYRGGKFCVLFVVGGVGLEPTTSRV